ncbi:uncharacterized protein LOC111580214 isoform X2 [Amphiprion ocellaris]|uniref:uncharacterized protein LOC111580214 isoform X2 n=1 Tax=Amphiprion ocellaris TaxID=80972 RepID=UPI0024118290|nr:uncharacterized protein LOC111580214 isoform X2 [Amphiprion ocellaris]
MDEYQHPLFFEAKQLRDDEKVKIRRHFQKRRESGGGDCGFVEKVRGKTYRICFKEKEDQERVLERKVHTIRLACEELQLTVSRTDPPQNLENTDQTTSSHPQTAEAKCLEKSFPMDTFLLCYLRDNKKASKALNKQLSSIGCTVELSIDEEKAVVRGNIEKGPGRAFGNSAEKWELQVDQVFIGLIESYLCYHVLDPKQVKMLLHDPSFATDDVKVYKESGYAVVVGEVDVVKEKIAALEKSLPIQKNLPVVEKQFKLVEEEFSREMRARFPEVTIFRQSGMITLEGLDKEVQSAAAKLDELIKKIKEKRVQVSTALMTFLTSSDAISKYQTRFQQSLRNPVSLDVGSDLVLSSLSCDALEEAAAAVLRDVSVATVELQGAAAVAPDLDRLKEILIKAKNDANLSELKVDVSFIPGPSGTTKVQLVGYSDIVNALKQVLHDYHMNQVVTQEVLNLPNPELVDCFEQILELIGMKQTQVTLKASHLPYPCVIVSGPRCLVPKIQADLNKALASLTSDTLLLNGAGVQRYFQREGKARKELVENSCQVVIKEQQQVHPHTTAAVSNLLSRLQCIPNFNTASTSTGRQQCNTPSNTPNTTNVSVNKTVLEVRLGSLVDEQVNVLVAPMISRELTSTKIGKCLLSKGGSRMQNKFDLVARKCSLTAGNVMQVDAPTSLGCSKIFFIECLPWDGVRGRSMEVLGNGLKRCLDLCVKQGWCSVALPVIGPGVALKYQLRDAIQVLTDKIHQFGSSASCGSLSAIHVVIRPDYPDSEECYHDVYRLLSMNMNQGGKAIFRSLTSDLDDITVTLGGGVKLQVVFGDITNETTDAVVNTTNFTDFQTGVCRDILTVAGPQMEAELRNAKVNRGDVFKTQPGSFPCKAILHVCGEKDAAVVEQLVCSIIQLCESSGHKSVAIPAICAGMTDKMLK